MRRYIEKIERYTLPVIALRGIVAFPGVTLSFEATDEICIKAAEAAFEGPRGDLPAYTAWEALPGRWRGECGFLHPAPKYRCLAGAR